MSFYITFYFLSLIFLLIFSFFIYKNIKSSGKKYFLLFIFSIFLWFLLYFSSFFIFKDQLTLLYISRAAFFVSILVFYFFGKYINHFQTYKKIKLPVYEKIFFGILFILYFFSDFIISDMTYISEKNDYYEVFGPLIHLHYILSLFFVGVIIKNFICCQRKISYINKIRLKFLFLGVIILITLCLIFQLFLPFFGIYLLEREVFLFVIPFLILSWYSFKKYTYNDISLKYKEFFSFVLSLILSFSSLYILKNSFLYFGNNFTNFWNLNIGLTYIDLFLVILFFYSFYKFFINHLPGTKDYIIFQKNITLIENRIRFILDKQKLINFLKNEANRLFKIKYIDIVLDNENKNLELFNFFENNNYEKFFINDLVFIEENKNKFDIEKIRQELNDKYYIIFPIKNNIGEIISILKLGKKMYAEQYYSEEILIINKFCDFLGGHLKYIDIYSKINYLSINLDKEIDKKTIKYNNLINKQKEFISVVSHELKNPIMAFNFQLDGLLDEIYYSETNMEMLTISLEKLKQKTYNLAELTNKLFTIQKYDLNKTNLYIQKIKLKTIFLDEIENLKNHNKNLQIDFYYDDNIDYLDLDKIQFTQVISNLLNNASKFANKLNPKIGINISDNIKNISITIEDNGSGFKNGEHKTIFEKYNTGHGKTSGLGLGLYLCKRITHLHNGKIFAGNSKTYLGAKIEIILPKNSQI